MPALKPAERPRSAQDWLALANAEFVNGDPAAIPHYRQMLRLAPNSVEGHNNLALALSRAGNFAEARREFERVLALHPQQSSAVYNLGLVLLELHSPREAVHYLQQACSLEPDRPDAAFNLVRALLTAGDARAARAQADAFRDKPAADAAWQASVGKLFLDADRTQDAIRYLEPALHGDPSRSDVRVALAEAHLRLGQPDAARQLLPRAQTPEEHFVLAGVFFAKRNLSEAVAEADQALRGDANEPRFLLLRARLHQASGEQSQALDLMQQAARAAPRSADPLYGMAVSYYFGHRYEEARARLDQALQLDPHASRSLFLYALTYENQARNSEAEDYLRRAARLEPDNSRYWFHLGTVLLRDGHPAEAKAMFRKAIKLAPHYALPHYEIGKLLAREGQPQAALEELELAIADQPSLAQAHYQLARVAAALGQKDKSEQAYATFRTLKKTDDSQTLSQDAAGELNRP